jgi:branched-chain amino acid transport system substrate-binding protein
MLSVNTRRLAVALAAATALLLPACGAQSDKPGQGSILKIGAPLPLTGSLNIEGKLTQEGYRIWEEWINQQGGIKIGNTLHKVEVKIEDDESKAATSVKIAERMLSQDGVQFLLGPYGSTATNQVARVAETKRIPMVEANGAAESIFSQGYRYTFGVLSPAKFYLKGVVDMALVQTPKPQTAVVLSANDAFSVEVFAATKAYLEQNGVRVVYQSTYPSNTNDVSALITKSKAEKPDLFLNSGHLDESVTIMKEAKAQQFNPKLFGFSVGPATPDFVSTLGKSAEFVFGGTQWTPYAKNTPELYLTSEQYVTAYTKKFGHEPDYHSAESTAACLALQRALETAGTMDPEKVRDTLAKLRVKTFFGEIRFDERGLNVYKPMFVEQIQNGKHVAVWPKDASNGTAKYPTPEWSARP